MRVLITDGNERATLAAARSLRAAGFEVHVAAATRFSTAGASRGVVKHMLTESALGEPERYATAVGQLAAALDVGVVLPVTDPSVEALLEYRGRLPARVVVPLPSLETYRKASDKAHLLDLAREAGLAVPATVIIEEAQRGRGIPGDDFFPAVLKPHRSVVLSHGTRRKVGVTFVPDRRTSENVLAALPPDAFPVLLQRRVFGAGEGLFVLRWNGVVAAVFAHRRLREHPPAGGQSVYRESIALDPDLRDPALRLLDALDWRGVAMVETKRDAVTGRPVIMEVNGRLWGSLQLAIDAGVDFPTLLVRSALGHKIPQVSDYRVGVRSRWLWGDLDHLYMRLRRSAAELQLDPTSPSRLGALWEFCRLRPGRDHCEIWRARDPGPFLIETLKRLAILR